MRKRIYIQTKRQTDRQTKNLKMVVLPSNTHIRSPSIGFLQISLMYRRRTPYNFIIYQDLIYYLSVRITFYYRRENVRNCIIKLLLLRKIHVHVLGISTLTTELCPVFSFGKAIINSYQISFFFNDVFQNTILIPNFIQIIMGVLDIRKMYEIVPYYILCLCKYNENSAYQSVLFIYFPYNNMKVKCTCKLQMYGNISFFIKFPKSPHMTYIYI